MGNRRRHRDGVRGGRGIDRGAKLADHDLLDRVAAGAATGARKRRFLDVLEGAAPFADGLGDVAFLNGEAHADVHFPGVLLRAAMSYRQVVRSTLMRIILIFKKNRSPA
jgi:hypothetical protein